MDNEEKAVTELSSEQAQAFLDNHTFGRIALTIADKPQLFPVNYVAEPGTIYLRTAPGDKLFAAATSHAAAFEVDEVHEGGATSVIAHGSARIVDTAAELVHIDELGLRPYIATWKPNAIAVDVELLSGRAFEFGPEPETGPAEVVD